VRAILLFLPSLKSLDKRDSSIKQALPVKSNLETTLLSLDSDTNVYKYNLNVEVVACKTVGN